MVHGKAYEVGAGKTVKMPGYIAWIYVYGQSVKAMQADGTFTSLNDEGFKQTYFEKFVAGVDSVIQQVEEVEPEVNTFADVASDDPDDETESEELDEDSDDETKLPSGGSTYTPTVKADARNKS